MKKHMRCVGVYMIGRGVVVSGEEAHEVCGCNGGVGWVCTMEGGWWGGRVGWC